MEPPPAPELSSKPSAPLGLAIASLVLGILSLVLSIVVLGALLAVVGLAVGAIYLRRESSRKGMARWGVALSVLGLVASLGFGAVYYTFYRHVMAGMANGNADLEKWEGVIAPDISVVTLDGQTVKLSGLKGKRVVLDFWATWCPPCRKEIPHFNKLFSETSRDQLVIVGISSEDTDTLRGFIKNNPINYPIASSTNLPTPYSNLEYIPTTFFIDRKGVIQTVAVGYHDYDTLKTDATMADYSGEPKAAPASPATLAPASTVLKPVLLWSTSIAGAQTLCVGNWDSKGDPDILVAAGSTLHVLNLDGAETSTVLLPDRFTMIECGRDKKNGPRLLGYANWGPKVSVVDKSGKELWHVSSLAGVDGAHWGDLNGDGSDELIVGMNGGGGLQAWSSDGKRLWSASMGNVWNQAVISATGKSPARVFATEAGGTVHVFDGQGRLLNTLRPNGGYYAQMWAARAGSQTDQILAINDDTTVAFDDTGAVLWTTSATKNNAGWRSCNFAEGDLEGNGAADWALIDGSGALVIASASGHEISSLPNGRSVGSFAIAPRAGKGGLLVTLSGNAVSAYSLQP